MKKKWSYTGGSGLDQIPIFSDQGWTRIEKLYSALTSARFVELTEVEKLETVGN